MYDGLKIRRKKGFKLEDEVVLIESFTIPR